LFFLVFLAFFIFSSINEGLNKLFYLFL
jgi:hypothetical protein